VRLGVRVWLNVFDCESDCDCVRVCVWELLIVCVWLGVPVFVAVVEMLGVAVDEGIARHSESVLCVCERVSDPVPVEVEELVIVGVELELGVSVADAEVVKLGVLELLGVGLELRDPLMLGVMLMLRV